MVNEAHSTGETPEVTETSTETEFAVTGSAVTAASGSEAPTTEADASATSDSSPAAEHTDSSPDDAESAPEPPRELTAAEKFKATTKLVFLAPDVPPIAPRPRRSELRELDDLLDREMRGGDSGPARDSRDDDDDREEGSSRRRNRRRGAEGVDGDARKKRQSPQPQAPAPVVTEPQKVKGSTRLEAKKQRRRDGRDAGRRRMVITESEFLARREAVDREMVVRATPDRIQIGVLEDRVLVEHYVARSSESSLIGNVYLGRVQNVLPSMEAAFVDIGRGRNAVLYSGEVDWSEFEGGNTARKIENALKPGDPVLVQVTKDPVGHKGARLTSQISLPGRFLVYVPGGAMNGISRKLPDTERARLKKILKEVLPTGAGVIVRTAAEGATEEQLTHDVQRLARQWESIQKRTEKGGGPALLHSEPDMLIKIIRDVFNEDFHRLVISGEETYAVIEEYLAQVAPDLLERVERYSADRDVFDEYRVTEQIAKALDRKVWLPSGGSLVIDRTEAMTVIDVNTGKFVGSGGNLEETVTKNNLEAAEEIVRQLRLRDVGGIIVIDFIDMVLESNRDLVLRRLVECLGRDRTKHQVAEVTSLGLVQMTRKKLGLGLLESFSESCETCAGRGIIVHHEPVSKSRNSGGNGSRGGKRQNNAKSPQNQQQHQHSQAHAISDGAKNMLAQVAASTLQAAKQAGEAIDASGPRAGDGGESRADAGAGPREAELADARGAGSNRGEARRTGRDGQGADRASTAQSDHLSRSASAERRDRDEAPAQQDAHATPRETSGGSLGLLDSILEALPEPPAPSRGRGRSRRVSVPTTRTDGPQDAVPGHSGTSADEAESGSEAPSVSGDAEQPASGSEAARRALADALDESMFRKQANER
ncbi:hypothetical protein GCM10009847_25950 [Leucobacter tardus]|uniref:Ribonuclease E n=1 Tax=Leucobacter tardus TaxID=501483 RepID=A0A939QD04_9MICO|nr:Rne/Rng family ribonuclease [Leucobacter tardus]MBO2989900.1 Rne/Rng family ribonuclease [Leucobacter tardus]